MRPRSSKHLETLMVRWTLFVAIVTFGIRAIHQELLIPIMKERALSQMAANLESASWPEGCT